MIDRKMHSTVTLHNTRGSLVAGENRGEKCAKCCARDMGMVKEKSAVEAKKRYSHLNTNIPSLVQGGHVWLFLFWRKITSGGREMKVIRRYEGKQKQ